MRVPLADAGTPVTRERRTEEAIDRAITIARRIAQGDDLLIRERIEAFGGDLDYTDLESLAIQSEAWERVLQADVAPRLVFAHPALLEAVPQASVHYRGIALLPLKRVTEIAGSVERWERHPARARVARDKALRVARLYNAVISSIILDHTEWTAEDGYRNVLATIGITEDGVIRNLIGQRGEQAIRQRMIAWIREHGLLAEDDPGDGSAEWSLRQGVLMRFGTEPDVGFSGTGGSSRSSRSRPARTPPGRWSGWEPSRRRSTKRPPAAATSSSPASSPPTMRERLGEMRMESDYDMDRLLLDDDSWAGCMNDIFHHALRIAPDVRPSDSARA